MATPTVDLLRQTLAHQAATAPKAADLQPYLTRYIFTPFHNNRLSTYKRKLFGLPNGLRQDIIERISRFDNTIVDDSAIARVPMNQWGQYISSGYGVSETKREDRRPSDVVAGLLRAVNSAHVSTGADDNGISEVTTMRGLDDVGLYMSLQETLLPQQYATAREKVAQLTGLDLRRLDPKYTDVRDELTEATNTAIVWGRVKYGQIQAAIELFGRTGRDGKKELSRFDRALCRWLELPEPRLHSMLDGQGQAAQVATQSLPPYVVCEDCGNMINRLPSGELPRKGCIVCGWNPNAVAIEPQAPDTAEFGRVTGDKPSTFADMQKELEGKQG